MRTISTWCRRIITMLLSLLGTAAGISSQYTVAYAPPQHMKLSGQVIDARTRLGIPGIRLRLLNGMNTEHLTNEEGRFFLYIDSSIPGMTIILEDIDGEANGQYHSLTNTVPSTGRQIQIPMNRVDTGE